MAKPNMPNTGIVVTIILVLLFFYVYQRVQIFRLGYKIRNIDKQVEALEKDNLFLQLKISSLVSPERISAEVKRLGLDLVPPKERQVVRVK